MGAFSKIILTILCLICQQVSSLLIAQTTQFLEGKVFDSATSAPLPFATIRLKNSRFSVYSNEDGSFRLIHNSEFQSDSVIITSINYKKYTIAFKDLIEEEINKIYLVPAQSLPETVKITGQNGKLNSIAIIRRSIGNITNRNPVKPFSYISYYRDYQKKDSSYINLNEAIVQTLDSGIIAGSISNVYRLIKFIHNTDVPRMNMDELSDSTYLNIQDQLIPASVTPDQYGNELFTLMALDPIRNFKSETFPFIDTFSENFIDNHNFSPPSEVFNNNSLLFKISFNGKTRVIGDSLLVSGAIYIQPKDYSIHKLEYSCYINTVGRGLKNVFKFEVEYEYNNANDSLMCLKYLSFRKLFNAINTDDKSYFRLLFSEWDMISNLNPTLTLRFNNKVDPVIASRKENYRIMIGKKEVKINSIQVVGENLFIRFRDEDVKGAADSIDVYFQGILKDMDGNILGKRKTIQVYQFRELFVQEFNKTVALQDSSNLQYLPSGKDALPPVKGKERYWMNTPEINSKLSPDK